MAKWTWEEKHKAKLAAIWFACGLLGAAIALYVAQNRMWFAGDLGAVDALSEIEKKLGLFGFLLDIPLIAQCAKAYPDAVIGLFGFFIIGGFIGGTLRVWGRDTFFAGFNDDVLTRVAATTRSDRERTIEGAHVARFVELTWNLGPQDGPRQKAWDDLKHWALKGALQRKGRFGGPEKRLSMQVLAGRAGSGKSRMSYELARHLARRDVLGSSESGKPAFGWRLATWLRRVILPLRQKETDPWDAGIISRNQLDKMKLKTWKPRRPTILLLDDPNVGATQTVWSLLTESSIAWRHPVRLLIANQTVPLDSPFSWDIENQTWLFDLQKAYPPPVMLPIEAWFSPEEVAKLAAMYVIKRSGELNQAKEFEPILSFLRETATRYELHAITRGNPLLVQLALEWIEDRKTLEGMTAEALSTARAGRILKALKVNKVESASALFDLALATLVGGVSLGRLQTLRGGQISDLPALEVLQACFPTDALTMKEGGLWVPPVRPDVVGDAFVEVVLQQIGTDQATRLANAAWRANPGCMLRALRRPRAQGSVMGQALADVDPMKIEGLAPIDLALALTDVAAICQPDDRPLSTEETRLAAVADAKRALDRLEEGQVRQLMARYASLLTIPDDQKASRQIRPNHAMHLLCAASARLDDGGALEDWLSALQAMKWLYDPNTVEAQDWDITGLVRCVQCLNEADQGSLSQALVDFTWLLTDVSPARLDPVILALPKRLALWAVDGTINSTLRILVYQAQLASDNPNAARSFADKAAKIANQHQGDAAIQLDAALARRAEVYAWNHLPQGAQASEARAAADSVAAIAARFPYDAAIQLGAAETRQYEAHAWNQVPNGAQATNAHAAAESAVFIAARFPDNAGIQARAATACRMEAYAWSKVPGGERANQSRVAAYNVCAIASRFRNDANIQNEALEALGMEAYAWNQVPYGAQATNSRLAAESATAIARRFPEDAAIHFQAAKARRMEVFAWSQVPQGAQATQACAAATSVAAIAAQFSEDSRVQLEAATAHRMEAEAWSRLPHGAQATQAQAAADSAAAIAVRFPNDAAIQVQAASARCSEAFAWSQKPFGVGAAQSHVAAKGTVAIASTFSDDAIIQFHAATAFRIEAYAWSQVPLGTHAGQARAAADSIAGIAMRFPDNAAIQLAAAETRRREAYAWCQVPDGVGLQQAKSAANKVRRIATNFPRDSEITKQLQLSENDVSLAEAAIVDTKSGYRPE